MAKGFLVKLVVGILIVGVIGGAVFLVSQKNKNSKTTTQETTQTLTPSPTIETSPTATTPTATTASSIFKEGKSVCEIFPKEEIEKLLGKTFHSVKSGENKTSKYTEYYCEYYQEAPGFTYEGNVPIPSKRIPISFVKGEISGLRESYKLSGYSVKQDNEIPFPHQLVYDQKGELKSLEIFLADDLDLIVNTYQSNLTQEEALAFVKKFALYLKDLSEK